MLLELRHEKTIGSKGHGLFGIPGAQLPAKMQHVYNDLVQGGKKIGGATYRLAVGIVQNWAHGGSKDPKVIAEATAAVAEWEKLKARAHARSGKKVKEDALFEEAAEFIDRQHQVLEAVAELTARSA